MAQSYRLFLALAVFCTALTSCRDQPLLNGSNAVWLGKMHTAHADIPFRFVRSDSGIVILNNQERILLNRGATSGDTLIFSFPHYSNSALWIFEWNNDQIKGFWRSDFSGIDQIAFTAHLTDRPAQEQPLQPLNQFFDVVFNSQEGVKSSAVGAFHFTDSQVAGTFMTPTGDYRFLEGQIADSVFWVSTFDGSHLYLARGTSIPPVP